MMDLKSTDWKSWFTPREAAYSYIGLGIMFAALFIASFLIPVQQWWSIVGMALFAVFFLTTGIVKLIRLSSRRVPPQGKL